MDFQFKGLFCKRRKHSSLLLHKLNSGKNDQAGKHLYRLLLSASPEIEVLVHF